MPLSNDKTIKSSLPVELAQSLIRIPSVNPDYDPESRAERDIATWIQKWGLEQGFETLMQPVLSGRSNVLVRLRNGADHPHLLLNGHMDTVGVTGMTIAPFSGEISDGYIWGRGATDMKSALACMLAGACRLRDQPASWLGTLTVGCTVDEEYRGRGVPPLMEDVKSFDYAVVGEPTSMQVVRGCKGCLRFAIRARGAAAHSSDPSKGKSAIVAMAQAVLELALFFQERLTKFESPEFGTSSGSIGLIEGGSGINIVPDHCSIQVDIRLIPGQDWKKTYEEIQSWVRARATQIEGIEWSFDDPPFVVPPFEISSDHVLVKQACEIVGLQKPKVVFYGCDANQIAAEGLPCIVMGPSDIAYAHTINESIRVTELEKATDQYIQLAQALMPPAITPIKNGKSNENKKEINA